MAKRWKSSPASHDPRPPETISGIARRYHAAAVALAQTLGLSVAEVLAQHRESVTAIFIETSRAELRLPAGVHLSPLAGATPVALGHSQALPPAVEAPRPGEVAPPVCPALPAPNGDPRPRTIPLDVGLPCGGLAIADLKPGQLSMLLSKVASLIHADGDSYVPLLSALQRERARRQAPGHIVPVRHIKELQPEASTRAIAEATGVSKETIRLDLGGKKLPPKAPDDAVVPEQDRAGGNFLPATDHSPNEIREIDNQSDAPLPDEVTAAPPAEASPPPETPLAPRYATPEQVRALKRVAAQVSAEAAEDLADVLDHSPKGLLLDVYSRIETRLQGRLAGLMPVQ